VVEDVLQRFLAKRLFDVGGEDARLDLLRQASDDVATILKESPERVTAFTMVAIDPDIPPAEPILAEVGVILQAKWNSYAGAFSDPTLPVVFRAIILAALEKIVGSEPLAAAVTLSCRNLLPRLGAKGDASLWTSLVDNAGHRLELRARREWAFPTTTSFEQADLELPKSAGVVPVTISRDWLTKQFAIASGPHNQASEPTGGNSVWPNSNDAWVHQFAPLAANAVGSAIESVAKKLAESVTGALDPKAQSDAITAYIGSVTANIAQISLGLERRNSLVWWKEALYSPSAERSYRSVTLPVAVALIAIDASKQTGPYAPRMAEAFLLEAIRVLDAIETEASLSLTSLCTVAAEGDGSDVVLEYFGTLHREPGRTSLASLIGSGDMIDGAVLERRIGLAGDVTFSPSDFGLWLFRDLQAAAATGPKPKRKTK
jgi:GTPase-associated system helical domain